MFGKNIISIIRDRMYCSGDIVNINVIKSQTGKSMETPIRCRIKELTWQLEYNGVNQFNEAVKLFDSKTNSTKALVEKSSNSKATTKTYNGNDPNAITQMLIDNGISPGDYKEFLKK